MSNSLLRALSKPKKRSKRGTLSERFWYRVIKTDTCWLWDGNPSRNGYGAISAGGYCGRSLSAHRVSYELHFGYIPDGLCVLHKCDVKLCVNPDHLFLGTSDDNNKDMAAKGRSAKGDKNGSRLHPERRARGEKQGLSKLTWEEVKEIRKRHNEGEKQKYIAVDYGVRPTTIWWIVNNKTWREE